MTQDVESRFNPQTPIFFIHTLKSYFELSYIDTIQIFHSSEFLSLLSKKENSKEKRKMTKTGGKKRKMTLFSLVNSLDRKLFKKADFPSNGLCSLFVIFCELLQIEKGISPTPLFFFLFRCKKQFSFRTWDHAHKKRHRL